jgi:hypothetical protein
MPAPARELTPFLARAMLGVNAPGFGLALVDAAAAVIGYLRDFVFGHSKTPAKVLPETEMERERWSGRGESNPRLKLGKLSFYR